MVPKSNSSHWSPEKILKERLPLFNIPVRSLEEESMMPAVDIFENEEEFVVTAELPGIREEDIEVSVIDGNLFIKGVKKTETGFTKKKYHRCERIGGSFCREIALPSTVDSRKVEAVFEDGVLEVTLSKSDEAKPKKIVVSARRKAGKDYEQARKASALSEAGHGW